MNATSDTRPSLWRRTMGDWIRQICNALFLDLPFLFDSRWRHGEYAFSRNHNYRIDTTDGKPAVTMQLRPRYRNSAFVLLILTLIFVAYGPTFAAVCGTTTGTWVPRFLYGALGTLFAVFGLQVLRRAPKKIFGRCNTRLNAVKAASLRAIVLQTCALCIVVLAVVICGVLTFENWQAAFDEQLCKGAQYHWRTWAQAGLTVIAVSSAYFLAKRPLATASFVRWQSLLVMAAWAINWWLLATPTALEADGVPYRHTFALFAAALFCIPLLANALARRLFRSVPPQTCAEFTLALHHTELFIARGDPELSGRRLINALVNGPLYHPLHLFFLPALVAMMAADDWLWPLCVIACVFSGLLLTWGYISTRWQQMVVYIDHWFFSGTPLIVSLAVIGIAAARLAGNQYVTTLLGAAPFGVIFMWILMTYALLWLFEQAIGQALGPQLLRILNDCKTNPDDSPPEYIQYAADKISIPLVLREHRFIAVHGAGRLAIVGMNADHHHVFHTYSASDLFATLAAHSDVVEEKQPQPTGIYARLQDAATDIDRRIKLYFNVLNAGVLIICGALISHLHSHDSHHATDTVVTASLQPPLFKPSYQHFDLTAALQKQAKLQHPAYIVAASGGGTRAAVYTASALRGLAQLNIANDIVLMSGVSGGGVALTYYAAHHDELGSGGNFKAASWQKFREQMAEPFIQDVLEGSMEWRITGSAPLSALLVESFERRLNHGDRSRFGDVSDLGLILNTSITGHPPSDSVLVGNAMGADTTHPHDYDCLPFTLLSGGRLVFTNIENTRKFPSPLHSRFPDMLMPYVTVRDPHVELWRAAALNANFPPVFPNARVDLLDASLSCGGKRTYDVTDGGATENLGLLSALYALQSSLEEMQAKSLGAAALPEIHIVALEASAIGYDYAQDRGIGTATGGSKERLAGGLTEQLLAAIETQLSALAGKPTTVQIHYLAMPTAFRSRGGVGTHWMMPKTVTITNPHLATAPGFFAAELPFSDPEHHVHVSLSKQQLFQLMDELHDPALGFCSDSANRPARVNIVTDWICGRDAVHPTAPDLHVWEWDKIVAANHARP